MLTRNNLHRTISHIVCFSADKREDKPFERGLKSRQKISPPPRQSPSIPQLRPPIHLTWILWDVDDWGIFDLKALNPYQSTSTNPWATRFVDRKISTPLEVWWEVTTPRMDTSKMLTSAFEFKYPRCAIWLVTCGETANFFFFFFRIDLCPISGHFTASNYRRSSQGTCNMYIQIQLNWRSSEGVCIHLRLTRKQCCIPLTLAVKSDKSCFS